jgi:hypothetical protein
LANLITCPQFIDSLFLLYHVEMEIQTCRKNDYFHLGFVDLVVANCVTLKNNPQETFDKLYKFLAIQHYKHNIVFAYNFQ